MSILIKKSTDIRPSEITPKSVYLDRRKFMKQSLLSGMLLAADAMLPAWARQWPELATSKFSTDESPNSFEDITTYNNFYEFGTGKEDPAKNAIAFEPRPWSISVEGECNKPGTFDLDDFTLGDGPVRWCLGRRRGRKHQLRAHRSGNHHPGRWELGCRLPS